MHCAFSDSQMPKQLSCLLGALNRHPNHDGLCLSQVLQHDLSNQELHDGSTPSRCYHGLRYRGRIWSQHGSLRVRDGTPSAETAKEAQIKPSVRMHFYPVTLVVWAWAINITMSSLSWSHCEWMLRSRFYTHQARIRDTSALAASCETLWSAHHKAWSQESDGLSGTYPDGPHLYPSCSGSSL